MTIRLAVDIGGTFTDLAAHDAETGELIVTKTSTTPQQLTDAVVGCIDRIGLAANEVELFIHGSTIGINTIVQRGGPPTALVTTEGFRDVYEMGRRNRPDIYDLLFHRPVPLVPRDRVFEVRERMDATGAVLTAMDDEQVRAVLAGVREVGVATVAVCLLHSYANPAHEQRVGALIEAELPGTLVSLSSDINREYREYERTSTTAMNAYLRPVVGKYLDDLQRRMADLEFSGRTLVMQSSGGSMTIAAAARQPVRIIESGPAGGVAGALWLCSALGYANAIAFDMGGTTAKACLVEDGRATVTTDYHVGGHVEGHPAQVPFLDIVEIGAGGGSIAAVDEVGALKVGPQSAGAEPGPACYGRGGRHATVTDANLVVGKLDPDNFLGGEMHLDRGAAERALREVGERLGLATDQAANGVLRLTNAMMAQAVSKVTVERGHDPRDFVLLAYGGAGPLHACAVARELGIGTVVVPPAPGQFSAVGMLTTDVRYDYAQTFVIPTADLDPALLDQRYAELEESARHQLKEDVGSDEISFVRTADMRYLGQFHSLTVEIPPEAFASQLSALDQVFHRAHDASYGHSAPSEPTEIISLRLAAFVTMAKPELPHVEEGGAQPPAEAVRGHRSVLWEDGTRSDCPTVDRRLLLAGNELPGPVVIEESATVVPVGAGEVARVDPLGNLVVSLGGR